MKKINKKGFTLIEIIAVTVLLAILILLAVFAIIPQIKKSRINAFGDEVLNYANGAETKYVADGLDSEYGDLPVNGICFSTSELKKEYVKTEKNYKGIVILKSDVGSQKLKRYVYLASDKYVYNSTNDVNEGLTGINHLVNINKNDIIEGNENDLTFKTCCEYYKSLDSNYDC